MFTTEEAETAYRLNKCPKCGSSDISQISVNLFGDQQKTPLPVDSIEIECNTCGEKGKTIVKS